MAPARGLCSVCQSPAGRSIPVILGLKEEYRYTRVTNGSSHQGLKTCGQNSIDIGSSRPVTRQNARLRPLASGGGGEPCVTLPFAIGYPRLSPPEKAPKLWPAAVRLITGMKISLLSATICL